MIRIGKMTDYGIVLLAYFARGGPKHVFKARDLSEYSGLPLPTVSKILKSLCRGGLLVSLRGIKGGYQLSKPSDDISVAEIIRLLEGPIAMTECSASAPGLCDLETTCPVRGNWQVISRRVEQALEGLSLKEMTELTRSGTTPSNVTALNFGSKA